MLDAPRVLIIGAGLTGSLIARMLQAGAAGYPVEIHVWEKGRGIGGRFSVTRSDTGGQADTGAQYITEVEGIAGEHRALYNHLYGEGTLVPMKTVIAGTRAADGASGKNWVAPHGINAVAKSLLAASNARVTLGRGATTVERVAVTSAAGKTRTQWHVSHTNAQPADVADELLFDAVVLTLPVPQVLGMGGEVAELLERSDLLDALVSVQYSSRYAASYFYSLDDAAAKAYFEQLPWASRYVGKEEDPDLVFISLCAAKRGRTDAEPPSVLVHSSVPFALRRMDSAATADVGAEMLIKLRGLLPGLPSPADSRTLLWRWSQVRKPLALPGGQAAIDLGEGGPPLVLAGDAYSEYGSRFDGCYDSARAASTLLLKQLGILRLRG
ncbi:hypothetical protein T492DRAFT_1092239 [Pavlovales sp. CCMP2436]|nr:hypothetical protein T492DRAFT_1092239 [Pavlovales sp. CCMP2436]